MLQTQREPAGTLFVKGIGRRLDGWPNRDLNVGAIVALAPNLEPVEQLLGADTAKVKQVLQSCYMEIGRASCRERV